MAREGARYGGVGIGASLINYAAYAGALALVPGLPPLLALAFGSAVAITASCSRLFPLRLRPLIFARPAAGPAERPAR